MSIAVVVTWSVSSSGGRLYAGVPSRDVAIALAVDLLRYEGLVRQDVLIETDLEDAEIGRHNAIVSSPHESRGLGVGREVRCASCRCVPYRAHDVGLSAEGEVR